MFGCGQSSSHALKVGKNQVKNSSWRYAMTGLPFVDNRRRERNTKLLAAFDSLIERELLAAEATERGFRVSDEWVDKRIVSGEVLILGHRLRWVKSEEGDKILPVYFDEDGAFDFERLQNISGRSFGGLSMDGFRDEQKKELLADTIRQTLIGGTVVSDEEVRATYNLANTKINADYIKFDTATYKRGIALSPSDLEVYGKTMEGKLKAAWENEKAQWSEAKPRALARIIKININKTPPSPDDKTPKPDTSEQDALNKAQKAKRQLADKSFYAVAKEMSDDFATKTKGGLLGWRSVDALGVGNEVSDAVKAMEPGATSDVIKTPNAYYIVKLEQKSEAALTFDNMQNILADRVIRDELADAVTKKAAEEALAKIGDKKFEDVFEKSTIPGLPPGFDPSMFLKENEQGSVVYTSEAIPAQSPETPSAEAKEPTPAPASAKQPSYPLPLVDVKAPGVKSLDNSPRNGNYVAGIGKSEELVRTLYRELSPGQSSKKVIKVEGPDGYVIVSLKNIESPDMEKFAKELPELREQMAKSKGLSTYVGWLQNKCEEAKSAGKIDINPALLIAEDNKQIPYEPCANYSLDTAAMQWVSRSRYEITQNF